MAANAEAVLPGEPHVEHNEVHLFAPKDAVHFGARDHRLNAEPALTQGFAEQLTYSDVILDE
jgi:hypothetical protein